MPTVTPTRILVISNGHGEDVIAVKILQTLQQSQNVALAALPIVGTGDRYRQLGIEIVGPVQAMPSGGFIYMDGRELLRDLRGGLAGLTWAQLRTVRHWCSLAPTSVVLAVGDIVPLLFGWMSGQSYAFVGTAKSDYYLRDEAGAYKPGRSATPGQRPTAYEPWERWLMRRPNCLGVFPRDGLTTQELQARGVKAVDVGNPMMDGFEIPAFEAVLAAAQPPLSLLLLPGSRTPEAYRNWVQIVAALPGVLAKYPAAEFLVAAAPALEHAVLGEVLRVAGWEAIDSDDYRQGQARLKIAAAFGAMAQRAAGAIAMAGTATEQFVGLGKPAIILPGGGPQFTPAFARAQTRLLGPSVTLVASPEQVGGALDEIFSDAERQRLIYDNGCRRMGDPGAGARIAAQLLEWMTRRGMAERGMTGQDR